MDSVRCVIVDMPQQLLADIVRSVAEESGAIEVVDLVNRIADVQYVIARQQVDVLITAMKSSSLPSTCVDMLDRFSDIPIVGLVDDGRRLAVFLNNAGKSDILRIITALGGSRRDAKP